MEDYQVKLFVFFTYGVSLKKWNEVGILSREIALYKGLVKYGVEVTFVTYGDSEEKDYLDEYRLIDVIPIYSIIKKSKNKYIRFIQSFVYIPFILVPYIRDVDIIKSKQIFGAWVPSIISMIVRKPYLLRTGYDYLHFFSKNNSSKIVYSLLLIIFRFATNSASKILVATKQDKDRMVKNFPNCQRKIEVSPNWVDTDKFKNISIKRYDNRILYVGRLVKQKNLPLLIDAIADTGIQADIVGDGDLKDDLINYAQEKNSKIDFIGVVDNDELVSIYNKYRVFVLLSTHEGNPKTLMEAMSCGMAVIGTNVIGIKQLISHKHNGILVEQDQLSIRENILSLLQDDKLQESISDNARRYICSQYSLKSYIERELELYEKMLSTTG
jgi:glycosyltransferase involved in cell wall biosynthesis